MLTVFTGDARQRGHDVVGLFALDLEHGNAVAREDLAHERKLAAQVGRHLVAMRLVLRIHRHASGGQALVERGDDVRRFFVGDEFREHHRETVGRVDRHAVRRGQRRQREERAVDEPVGVEQHQARGLRRRNTPFAQRQRDVAHCTVSAIDAAPTSPSSVILISEST